MNHDLMEVQTVFKEKWFSQSICRMCEQIVVRDKEDSHWRHYYTSPRHIPIPYTEADIDKIDSQIIQLKEAFKIEEEELICLKKKIKDSFVFSKK